MTYIVVGSDNAGSVHIWDRETRDSKGFRAGVMELHIPGHGLFVGDLVELRLVKVGMV